MASQKSVLSIDVGLEHLGFVYLILQLYDNKEPELIDIKEVGCLNIFHYEHNLVSLNQCSLYHTGSITDCMNHIFQEYPCFNSAAVILIERQPFSGIKAVEEIILHQYRKKTILVAPSSMHAHFSFGKIDYHERKKKTKALAIPLFEKFDISLKDIKRTDDICDALCIFLYWKETNSTKLNKYFSLAYGFAFKEKNPFMKYAFKG